MDRINLVFILYSVQHKIKETKKKVIVISFQIFKLWQSKFEILRGFGGNVALKTNRNS
jgi:hypothetical protein